MQDRNLIFLYILLMFVSTRVSNMKKIGGVGPVGAYVAAIKLQQPKVILIGPWFIFPNDIIIA